MSAVTKLMTPGGGGVALTPASSIASDVTVNVPSQNCTLGIQGPAFSAYLSGSQTPSGSTWTKVTLDTEEFDTNNNFASSRFTPTVAGYYQINGSWQVGSVTTTIASIYKNGSQYKSSSLVVNQGATGIVSALVYLDGSTDYVEFYCWMGTSQALIALPYTTWFNGALVRAA